jgi:hypothetical protein
MNIADEEERAAERRGELEDVARLVGSKITPTPWLLCAIARMMANTTIPRISKTHARVVHDRDELHAVDVQDRDEDERDRRDDAWSALPRSC